MTVRTRFAPSPTGFLHIGGVRTALFNWLLARHHGGQFILRVDDTDQSRHVEQALAYILDGFRWIGMDWDEGPEVGGPHQPYFQSQRSDFYRAALEKLIAAGQVYRDYTTPAEREQMRKESDAAKKAFRFRRISEHAAQESQFEEEGRPFAWRFEVPLGGSITIPDVVRGEVTTPTDDISDFVIARSDGSPLYNFATVVDDAQMEITHVVRAEEHLSNTFPQWLLYEALGQQPPKFAHVPFVAAPGTKRKLSKRDGFPPGADGKPDPEANPAENFTNLAYYRQRGYLPEAMMNYLARLGWSYDDHTELFTREQLIEYFTLERVVDSPAGHDADKLFWVQGEKMRDLTMDRKVAGTLPYLVENQLIAEDLEEASRARLEQVITALGDRLKVFSDILTLGRFFFLEADGLTYDPAAVKKRLQKQGVPAILEQAESVLKETEPFDEATLEPALKAMAEVMQEGVGKVVNAVRVAVTGQAVGPGLYEALVILGPEECCLRLSKAREMLATQA